MEFECELSSHQVFDSGKLFADIVSILFPFFLFSSTNSLVWLTGFLPKSINYKKRVVTGDEILYPHINDGAGGLQKDFKEEMPHVYIVLIFSFIHRLRTRLRKAIKSYITGVGKSP